MKKKKDSILSNENEREKELSMKMAFYYVYLMDFYDLSFHYISDITSCKRRTEK